MLPTKMSKSADACVQAFREKLWREPCNVILQVLLCTINMCKTPQMAVQGVVGFQSRKFGVSTNNPDIIIWKQTF